VSAPIVNPRRALRAPTRCRAAVVFLDGSFVAETENIGSRGCQIVSPARLCKGDRVQLVVTTDGVAEPLHAAGKVAWVSPEAPWRVGIAFDEGGFPEGARWFERLVATCPGAASRGRVPERIPVEATVFLGPPPRFLVDFTADEAALLRTVASGARIEALQAKFGARWPSAQRALFSLLSRQAVTLARGQAVHPDAWERILAGLETSAAVGWPARPDTPAAAARPAAAAPAPPPTGQAGVAHRAVAAGAGRAAGPAQPDFLGAGVGWRAPRARPAEAQAVLDRARTEVQAGNVTAAIALLRRALAYAPGDAEIAGALGALAFKDRTPDPV